MATHDVFYPLILAELPGCPLPLVRSTINRAAKQFCDRSKAWTETLDPVPVRAGVTEYEIEAPTDALLGVLTSVKLDGRKLDPSVEGRAADWGNDGEPTRYAMPVIGLIELDRAPTKSGLLTLRAVLMPSLSAETLPDVLADRYFEAIGEGAKSLLKRMPNQPWSDPAGAQLAEITFNTKTDEARIEVDFGFVQGSMRVTPRAFG